ncbi:putative papain-like cysteine peptidase superfamily [Helianthus anomalus]
METLVYKNDILCTSYGTHLMHFCILDLPPKVWLSSAIIDCWASMLNHEEVKRREFTMLSRFCHTRLFVRTLFHLVNGFCTELDNRSYILFSCFKHQTEEMLTRSSYDDNKRLEMFITALEVVLEERQELMDLKEYGNLIFPILERSHFYLVCFDLKNCTCYCKIITYWTNNRCKYTCVTSKHYILLDCCLMKHVYHIATQ